MTQIPVKPSSSITPIPEPEPPMRRNTPRNVGLAAVAAAGLTFVAQMVQALGGLPEVMKAVVHQGWYAAGALAMGSVFVLIFQVIRSADAARVAADERADSQYVRMGAMLNEMSATLKRIADSQSNEAQAQISVAQALEGLRQHIKAQPPCPMRDAKTDPSARVPQGSNGGH